MLKAIVLQNMSLLKNIGEFNGVKLSVLQLHLSDVQTGGNKLFKLKYNLEDARLKGHDTLLTFGGAYSNHIAATAAAGKRAEFKTIGIIRGEKISPLNKTLKRAADNGMHLQFVSREQYRQKEEPLFIESLKARHGNFYLLTEGGSNELAVKGCKEIVSQIGIDFDYIVCPTATGATLTGIALSLLPSQQAVGICVLNNKVQIENFVNGYIKKNEQQQPEIIADYTFNGYAKSNDALNQFVKTFTDSFKIRIEPIYTGKMFYGLFDLIGKNYFKAGSHVIAVHTGGLQYL